MGSLLQKAQNLPSNTQKWHSGRLNHPPSLEEVRKAEAFSVSHRQHMSSTKYIGTEYLCHFKFHTPSSLSIGDSKIGREAVMPDYRRQRIPMLMCQPFTEGTNEYKKNMRDVCALFAEICMA